MAPPGIIAWWRPAVSLRNVACPTEETKLWLSLKKAIVDLSIRIKENSKRTSCNSLSPLGAQNIACDHALSLYLCNLFSGGGHDTFLLQITCKKARIWTFFWLDRKQYGWFAPFRLAKMPPPASFCWVQSAFLLVNTHASSLSNFCRLSFLEFTLNLNRNFIHWNIFHLMVYLKVAVKNSPISWMQFDTSYKLQRRQTGSLFK